MTFNLLPKEEKEMIRREYVTRRIVVILSFLLLTIGIALLSLVPPHVISWYKFKEMTHTQGLLKENVAVKNRGNLNSVIDSTNAKIQALDVGNAARPTDIFSDISERRTSGVRITSLVFQHDEKGKSLASIEGEAADRESLLAFVRSLKENDAYSQVDLPISNLVKETDIKFTLSTVEK